MCAQPPAVPVLQRFGDTEEVLGSVEVSGGPKTSSGGAAEVWSFVRFASQVTLCSTPAPGSEVNAVSADRGWELAAELMGTEELIKEALSMKWLAGAAGGLEAR